MNVSRITISRLYNLGNYEHIKYEITVDVDPLHAHAVVTGLENIIASLNPKPPEGVLSVRELNNASAMIKEIEALEPAEVEARYGDPKDLVLSSRREQLKEAEAKTLKWYEVRKKARLLLDNLGGAVTFTDHKELWDDEYPDFTNA